MHGPMKGRTNGTRFYISVNFVVAEDINVLYSIETMLYVYLIENHLNGYIIYFAANSQIFSFVSDTIAGLACIRASSKERHHLRQFMDAININSIAYFMHRASMRWFIIRVNFLMDLFMLGMLVTTILMKDSESFERPITSERFRKQ